MLRPSHSITLKRHSCCRVVLRNAAATGSLYPGTGELQRAGRPVMLRPAAVRARLRPSATCCCDRHRRTSSPATMPPRVSGPAPAGSAARKPAAADGSGRPAHGRNARGYRARGTRYRADGPALAADSWSERPPSSVSAFRPGRARAKVSRAVGQRTEAVWLDLGLAGRYSLFQFPTSR